MATVVDGYPMANKGEAGRALGAALMRSLIGALIGAAFLAFSIPIVRPLLDTWREETVVYCATNGFRPRHDPSNASLDFFRNRLRHLRIPTLETYNPRFREVLWRTYRSLAGDYEILSSLLDDVWKECARQENADFIAFDASTLTEQSVGIQRSLIRRAMERLHDDQADVSYSTLERASSFIATKSRSRMDLQYGLHLLREGQLIYESLVPCLLPTSLVDVRRATSSRR